MQVWISLQKDCRIAVRKCSLTFKNHTSYLTVLFWKVQEEIYQQHEKEKYNQRMIAIEKSSFNPLIIITSGGMAPESARVNKRLAEKIAGKHRAICICHNIHNKAQICPFEEHCCNI